MMYILDNRYEIEKEAGRGGTSIVYKAYDLQAERAVRAIKEINKDNSAIYELAKKESKLIKELYEQDKSNSFLPNIIHTFGTQDKFYIVQDFLDGESMDKMLENGAMPYDMFIESAKQICSFMEFFHRTGKVHSDMKPENIMVLKPSTTLMDGSRKKSIKLKFIDFGTAIKNESGVTGYTPEYASREQYEQRPNIDKRSDIFNIGATFYHMLCGKKPMKVSNETRALFSDERFIFDKNVNFELKKIIRKCVEDDPDKRYKSCNAIYKDLCRVEKRSNMRYIALSFAVSVFCFSVAGFSAYRADALNKENNSNNYSINFNKGNYAEAIKIDHTNRDDIYSKLIEKFTEDEKLDSDEDNFIINEIKSLDSIKETDSNYGRCMYEIGNAYWLYYCPVDSEMNDLELEKIRITASYEWFEKAVGDSRFRTDDADSYNRAVIFYNIGKFYAEIDRKERDGTDNSEFYNDMRKNVSDMAEYIDEPNEVISARVCQTLLSLISRYSAKFRQMGITEESQVEILDRIDKKVYSDGNITYMNKYSINIAENFNIDAVRQKTEMAYSD